MTLNASIDYALFAMDVYNRGYAGGMGYQEGPTSPEVPLADIPLGAKIVARSGQLFTEGGDAAQSFYAVAYEYNGEVIISYRGTDDRNLLNFNGDAWTGWGVGVGNPASPQGIMALQFYQYVLLQTQVDPSDVVLTGHSLGGGLAGLVASVYGLQAVVFDNMTYQAAALEAYARALINPEWRSLVYGDDPMPLPNGGGVTEIAMQGEILAAQRLLFGPFDIADQTFDIDPAPLVNELPLDLVQRHSTALLVLRMFADQEWNDGPELAAGARYVFPALYDDAVAKSIGVQDHDDDHKASYVLSSELAYATQSGTPSIYGNAAPTALFQDMHDIGAADLIGGLSFAKEIGAGVIRYAGGLAKYAVSNAHQAGFLTYDDAQHVLTASFTDPTWTFNGTLAPDNETKGAFLKALGDAIGVDVGKAFGIVEHNLHHNPMDGINTISFALGNAVNDEVPEGTSTGTSAYVGTSHSDVITGSAFDDVIFGGTWSFSLLGTPFGDTINGGAGNDVLFGTNAIDRLDGGAGVDFIFAGDGNDIVNGSDGEDYIDLGKGNDVVESAAVGSIIVTGEGEDTIAFSHGVLVQDATGYDRITFAGFELENAVTWKASESDWAYGLFGLVKVGFNTAGEMVLGWTWEVQDGPENYMYLTGPKGRAANNDPLAASADLTAGIRVAVLSWEAHPLIWFIQNDMPITQETWWRFWQLTVKDFLSTARVAGSDPLVLDLDGDGVELTQMVNGHSPMFDTDGDGFAEYTGWVGKDDGMLAVDLNSNGVIDSGAELFGDAASTGFAELATYDSNSDGVINASDTAFGSLRVWRDLNQDGRTDAGEVQTLASLNITSISLSNTATGTQNAGNTVARTGSFTRGDGTTGTVADVELTLNNVDTVYTGNRTVNPALVGTLPDLKGKGTLTDLHVAITLEGTGGNLAATIASVLPTLNVTDIDTLRDRAEAIIEAWVAAPPASSSPPNHDIAVLAVNGLDHYQLLDFALSVTEGGQTYWVLASGTAVRDSGGNIIAHPTLAQVLAQSVPPSSNATWQTFSGHDLDFLERYFGDTLPLGDIEAFAPGAAAALANILDAAVEVLDHTAIRLAVQGPLAEYFPNIRYDAATDKFLPVTGDGLRPMFEAILADAPSGTTAADAYLDSWMPLVNAFMKDFVRTQSHLSVNTPYLVNALIGAYEAQPLDLSLDQVMQSFGVDTSGITKVVGTTAQGNNLDNILYLSSPNATMVGGEGGDTYIVGKNIGHTVINDYENFSAYDTLRFTNYDAEDLTFTRVGRDVIITVNATGETVTLVEQYYERLATIFGEEVGPSQGVEEIIFADGTVWTSGNLMRAVSHADSASTTLTGTDHNDYLDGGAGDDTLSGGDGSDIYVFGRGYGHDTAVENGYYFFIASRDFVYFAPGITKDDLTFSRGGGTGDIIISINGTGDTLTIADEFTATYTWVFGAQYIQRIESFIFADGGALTDLEIAATILAQAKTTGDDHIVGFDLEDTLDGGLGNDLLQGGNENDTYIYGTNYGHDVIADTEVNFTGGEIDTLKLKDGLSIDDFTFVRVGGSDDLTLVLDANNSVKLQGQFSAAYTGVFGTLWFNRIEYITFETATGTDFVSATDIMLRTIASQTTSGNDSIYGFSWEDTLDGGAGDDFLSGGNENDTYLFGIGSGHDSIRDAETNILSGQDDRIVFADGIGVDDVTFSHPTASDLLITLASGDTLRVLGQFDVVYGIGTYAFDAIEAFQFTVAGVTTTLSNWQVMQLVLEDAKTSGNDTIYGFAFDDLMDGGAGDDYLNGGNGNDTYIFGFGYGHDTVNDLPNNILADDYDRVIFKGAVTPADVTFSHPGNNDDLLITLSDGSTMLIQGMFEGGMLPRHIEEFYFEATDTFLYAADLAKLAVAGSGTSGNDVIYGFSTDDRLDGLGGDDILRGQGGSDTYKFGRGDGHDLIDDASGDYDVLAFKAGVNPGDIVVTKGADYRDVVLNIADTGESITISQQGYAYTVGPATHQIEAITFANGTVWSTAGLRQRLFASEATSGNDTINGFFSADVLTGGAGNDSITGHGGGDTYVFSLGDGVDTIHTIPDYITYDDHETVLFGAGISLSNLIFARNGNALEVRISGTSDKLVVAEHFTSDGYVELFRFANGDFITGVQANALATIGSTSAETIYGSGGGDIVNGKTGDDTLYGGGGGDTYLYALGDGHDVIMEGDGREDTDIIKLAAGIAPAGVTVSVSGSNLVLTFSDGGNITLDTQLTGFGHGVEAVIFADGTRWSRNDLAIRAGLSLAAVNGTSAAETLNGSGLSDVIDGKAGNDTLQGGNGSDVYVFTASSGNDTIADTGGAGDFDIADLSAVNRSAVSITRSGHDLVVTVTATGQTLRVTDQFTDWQHGIEVIRFADQTLSALAIRELTALTHTNGNETVQGGSDSDTVVGGPGDDILYGSYNNDVYVYSAGDGNDQISEEFNGGDGDQLYIHGIDSNVVWVGNDADKAVLHLSYTDGSGVHDSTVTLWGGFGDYYSSAIEQVIFDNGTVWSPTTLREMALAHMQTSGNDTILGFGTDDRLRGGAGDDALDGGNGNDTYVYAQGGGNDIISEGWNSGSDRLEFFDLASTDIAVSNIGNDAVLTVIKPGVSGSVRLAGGINNYYSQGVESIVFTDGVSWSRGTLANILTAQAATSGNDTVDGFDTNDLINGRAGDDILRGHKGDDTYVYAKGEGLDTVTDYQLEGTDTLLFSDLDRADLHAARSGNDMILTFSGLTPTEAATTRVTLSGEFNWSYSQGIEYFRFADSEDTFGLSDILVQYLLDATTAGNDTLDGFDSNDRMYGHDGNDTLRGQNGADRLYGEAGNDNLQGEEGADKLYGGDGDDTLNGGNGTDVLDGGAGNDTVDYSYTGSAVDFDLGLGLAYTSSSTTETLVDVENVIATSGVNLIRGSAGDNKLFGLAGSDTYFFTTGHDEITDQGNTADTDAVDFGALPPAELTFTRTGTSNLDLLVTVVTTGDTLLIHNQFGAAASSIEYFRFAGGVVWDATSISSAAPYVGTAGNDAITGTAASEIFVGHAGQDTLSGLGGSDTYRYALGDGNDTINETNSTFDTDVIEFSDLNYADVQIGAVGSDLILTIAATGHTIKLAGQAAGTKVIEELHFANGQVLTLETMALSAAITGPAITSNGGGATASITVGENGSSVTTVTASAEPGRTYSLGGGADAAKFSINATTGVLTFLAAPNFESPTDSGANNVYDVVVKVTDSTGIASQALAVTVANVNEAPVLGSNGGGATAAVTVSENATAVTTVTSTDVDAGATKTFSITGGADAAKFFIDASTGALTFIGAPDFETPTDSGANNVYDVIVQVSDGSLTDGQAIAVTVSDVAEAPVITSNGGGATASIGIGENGTAVTTVTASGSASKTYSLNGGADAAKFTINATTGVLTFIGAPDFETPTDSGANNVYDIIVKVTDGALTDTQTLAVTVTNVNEAPVISSNGGGATAALTINENTTAVITVTSSDVDAGATKTYSISGGADAAKFTINSSTGVLTFVAAPDFETPTDSGTNNAYDVVVQVSDGTLTDTQAIAVTVADVAEAPVITSNGGGATAAISVGENGTAVTTVTASGSASKTFALNGGADAAKFSINATTGVLTFIAAPNFESSTDSGANNVYDVIVKVTDGAQTDTQTLAVTVTNVNEAPVISSNGGGATAAVTINENATAVTTVTSTDVDTGATKAFSISGGADAAKFAINSSTGALTFVTAPDFETPTDAGVNNIYDVVVQVSDGALTDTQAIAVTVAAVAEAPVITSNGGGASAAISLGENGTAVTTVVAIADTGKTKTYSLNGGVDAAKFAINASTGVLTFIAAPDFETAADGGANNVYDVIVQVSDGSLTDTQAIAVTVANVNEAPVITSNGGGATAAISVGENGTAVTTVTSTDVDAGATKTFSISGGADAAKFAINSSTGVLTFVAAPNFEAPTDSGANNVYDLIVQVSDGTLTDTQTIAVAVTNVNEAPVISSNGGGATAAVTINENATAVTTVTSTDVDAGATKTFSINGGADAAKFAINSTTGVLSFVAAPDFETPTDSGANNLYDVIVQVSDGALTATQAIAVTVADVTESGTITGTSGNDTLTGTSGADTLYGLAGNDTLNAGDGNDLLIGGAGADVLNGGLGTDTASYETATSGVSINLNAAASTYTGDANGDTFSSIEIIKGTAYNDMIAVAGGGMTAYSGDGDDVVYGDWGNDILVGGLGNDVIRSGDGADELYGDWGIDTLYGEAGNDLVNGGGDDDVLIGGAGADVLQGDAGFDIASYETASAGIYLHTGNLAASTGDAAGDTFSGIEALRGSAFNDEIIVTVSNGTVWGGDGADTLTMTASGGSLYGENGADLLYGSSTFADVLNGGAGNDELYGDGGADTLEGGSGNDWLVGGAGNDTFVFRPGFGDDGVSDFQIHNGGSNGDVIEIHDHSGLTFSAIIADAEQWGPNAHLDVGSGEFITLYGVAVTDLTTQDFRFM